MRIIGIVFIIVGLVDVIGSWGGYDFWGEFMGIRLPDILWMLSGYIELTIGYFLFNLGTDESEASDESSSEE